jgi:hypothetical protein
MDRMFAREASLYHMLPKLVTVPICVDVCVPPLLRTRCLRGLGLMFDSSRALLNTDTVDWLSSRIQELGMPVRVTF